MKKVELKETNVQAAFRLATPETQTVLKVLFPDVEFKKKIMSYTDIEEFEDALSMVEDSHTKIGDLLIEEYNQVQSVFSEGTYYHTLAQARIWTFAANGCDESFPDWKNESQEKRHPWFYMDKSGVGFSFNGAGYACSCSDVGSRLEFKDVARCKYFAEHKNFKPKYKIIFHQ